MSQLETRQETGPTQALIGQLRQAKMGSLSFPPELEQRFEAEAGDRRAARMWHEGLAALLVLNLFYVADACFLHGIPRRELVAQFVLTTPLGLAACELMRRRAPTWLREGALALAGVLGTLACLATHLRRGAQAIVLSLLGVIVIELVLTVFLRLRFRFAVAVSAALGCAILGYLRLETALTMEQTISAAAMAMLVLAIATVSNFTFEREERACWLNALESEMRRQEVAQINTRLAEISSRDKLTGLPNRRAYEEQFDELWNDAAAEGTALSAIVIDVDHFKSLNDVCGHIYGDAVLRRVGALLPQALRSTADFAARFGGEEFVVLLPRTERESAERVAERVRALIEMAGSPPQTGQPQEEVLMWVTVSCGVATSHPGRGERQTSLIGRADRALYRAKAEGRNCIWFEASDEVDALALQATEEDVA